MISIQKKSMETPPKQPVPAANPLGTTMRIEINPEALHEAKRGKARPAAQPVFRETKPSVTVTPLGGIHFQQLLQNIYDGAFVTERSGEIIVANIRANQFFLAEPGQLQHQSIVSLICGADESLLPTILTTLQDNRFVFIQAYCQRRDGTSFPAEISVNQITLGGKEYLSFFVRDVTLRKQQEERLRTGYTAIQNASSGIAIAGLDATIEYCNPAFLSYFGLPAEASERRNFREFLCQPELADTLMAAIWRGETWTGELELRNVEGGVFFGHTAVTPSLDEDGELVGMVFSVLDITPQKRAQQQLQDYAAELHSKNTQMQEDLNMASELHEAFLPRGFESFPRNAAPEESLLAFRHLYHPSGTIGGDFFDIRELSDHEVSVFICDVMGHGVRSALVVATIRGLLEQIRPRVSDPGTLLTQLNATYASIFKHMGGDVVFATALYLVLDVRTGAIRYANAGHPRPYLLRPDQEEVARLSAKTDTPSMALGLFVGAKYRTITSDLAARETLLFYTDGLSEVLNPEEEFYETQRFEEILRKNLNSPPKELLENLFEDALAFSMSQAFEDDICLLAMRMLRTSE